MRITEKMTVERGALCCPRCLAHELERGVGCCICESDDVPIWVEDAVVVELEVSGRLYPAEPDVGLAQGGIEDVEATYEGHPFTLTEEEEDLAEVLLTDAAQPDDCWLEGREHP